MSVAAVLEPEEEEAEPTYDFGESFQAKIAALLLRDTIFAQRTNGLIKPEYFDSDVNATLVTVGLDHFAKYKQAIDKSTIAHVFKRAKDAKLIRDDLWEDVKVGLRGALEASLSDRDLVINEISDFAKNRAMEKAILESAQLLAKRDYSKIKKLMSSALLVGAGGQTNSYDYWKEIANRTTERKDRLAGVRLHDGIPTGIPEFDKLLYHKGWGRKELTVIMGAAKGGKSMSLGEFGKNASLLGYNVLLFSCEVAAKIIADRVDANVADMMIKIIGDNPIKVQEAVERASARAGAFIIEEYASGSLRQSEARRVIEHHLAQGVMFDLIIVDYGDIMAPEFRTNEKRDDLCQIFIDLRAIGFDYNAAMLTATQSNREGMKGSLIRATDVADDINKIRTADLVITINSNDAEKLAGETRILFAAARNSEDGFVLRVKGDRQKMQFMTKVIGREAS